MMKDITNELHPHIGPITYGVTYIKHDESIKTVQDIKQDYHAAQLGYQCIGKMTDLYPDMPEPMHDWYRTWIWENDKGERIATWDQGNTWCEYMCDGSEEKLTEYLQDLIDNPRY
jgi:hypothetical protein